MDTISEAFLLHFPGGDPILPEIQGNETVSLGDLDYDTLPIPEP
jgi:hypothetical protein